MRRALESSEVVLEFTIASTPRLGGMGGGPDRT